MKRETILSTAGLAVSAVLFAGSVVAQTTPKAPYYNNTTATVNNGTWLSGLTDGSLDSILTLAVRTGTFLIGGGVTAQGGVGLAGSLLTGGLVGAVTMGAAFSSRAGPVGGAVFAVASTFLFMRVAIGPTWLYSVALFGVGLVATAALIRVLQ